MKKSFVSQALALVMASAVLISSVSIPSKAAQKGDPVYDSMTQPSESMSDYTIKAGRNYGHILHDANDPQSLRVLSMGALYTTTKQTLPEKFTVYLGKITLFAYSKSQKRWIIIDDQPHPCGIYLYTQPWETAVATKCKNVKYLSNGEAQIELTREDMASSVVHFWGKTAPIDHDDYLYYASAYNFRASKNATGKLTAMNGIDTKDAAGKTFVQLFSSRGLSSQTWTKTHWGHTVPNDKYDEFDTSTLNTLFKTGKLPEKETPDQGEKSEKKKDEKKEETSSKTIETNTGDTTDSSLTVPKIKKISFDTKKSCPRVHWKKDSSVDGYEIQYCTHKHFNKHVKEKTITKASKHSKSFSKLKSGKKYYFRVRSYKNNGTSKIYSEWSKVKSYKVK